MHGRGLKRKTFHWVLNNIALYSMIILCAPFLIWILWIFIKGRGKWRIGKAGNKPHYVRTWHGWAEAEDGANSVLRHARIKQTIQKKLIWKTTTADYSWIFWDVDGTKYQNYRSQRDQSILRYLPTWLRSHASGSLEPGSRIAPNRLGAAEEGKISLRSFRHSSEIQPVGFSFTRYQAWARSYAGRRNSTVARNPTIGGLDTMMTGAVQDSRTEDSSGTVRRRKRLGKEVQVWNANSQETLRATHVQFLSAKKTTDVIPGMGPATGTAPTFELQSTPEPHHVSNGFTHRAFSLPPFAALRNTYHLRHWSSSTPAANPPLHSQTAQVSYPDRVPQGIRPPENSEELHSPCHHTSCHNMARQRTLENLHILLPHEQTEFLQNLNQQLEICARPVILNPLASVGAEYSGTDGRPGSPAMDWTSHWEPRDAYGHELNEYEDDGNLDGASSFQCSSRSSTSLYACFNGEYQKLNSDEGLLMQAKNSVVSSKLDSLDRMSIHGARRLLASDGAFKARYAPGEISLDPCRPLQAGYEDYLGFSVYGKKKALDEESHSEHVSLIKNLPESPVLNPKIKTKHSACSLRRPKNRLAECNVLDVFNELTPTASQTKSNSISRTTTKAFGIESGSKTLNRSKNLENPRTTALFSSDEKSFLDDLHRRLHRLDYELSPGFRGPQGDSTDPKWWFEAIPFSALVVSRASRSLLPGPPTQRSPLNAPPVQRRSFTISNISQTKDSSDTNGTHKPRVSAQGLPGCTLSCRSEPDMGAIDTAAWMLRRPPMGAFREDSADKTLLFTSGRGPSKTLSEWQQSSEPFQPIKQALQKASKISKLPAKHLCSRLGKLNLDRTGNGGDEKMNTKKKKKSSGSQRLGSCSDNGRGGGIGETPRRRVPTTAPAGVGNDPVVVERSPRRRLSVVMDENVDWGYVGVGSPNRTMMQ